MTCKVIGFIKVCYGCDDNSFCDSPLEEELERRRQSQTPVSCDPLTTYCKKYIPPVPPDPTNPPDPTSSPTSDAALRPLRFKTILGSQESKTVQALAAQDLVAFLRVPDVTNPLRWSTSRLIMSSTPFAVTDSGWKVVFIKTPGPAAATVTPPLTPTINLGFNSKALSAYVILPENGVATQYWVNVSDQLTVFGKNHSILRTPNWTVLFYRDPMS